MVLHALMNEEVTPFDMFHATMVFWIIRDVDARTIIHMKRDGPVTVQVELTR